MLKSYVVATRTAVTLIVLATDEADAIDVASQYYFEQYGWELDHPEAYEITEYLQDMYPYEGIWELPTC